MTRSLYHTSGLSESDVKVLTDIKEFGWHTVGVFPKTGEEGPNWAYSIGLYHSFSHPEVIITGLSIQTCMTLVNEIGKLVKSGGAFLPGRQYPDILQDPYKCVFQNVLQAHYRDYVGYAIWFYEGDNFPLLQGFWPDKHGLLPWNEESTEHFRTMQPLLYT